MWKTSSVNFLDNLSYIELHHIYIILENRQVEDSWGYKVHLEVLKGLKKCILISCKFFQFSSVQSLSRVRLFATPWIAAHQASMSTTNSWSSLRFTSIESVMPSSCLILCNSLLLMPPIPSSIKVFSNESTLCMIGQSTGVSALASFLPKKSQGWSP